PDTRPPAIIILACRPAIVKRDNIVFLDRIRPADMMCPPMLGIRNLSPGFPIPRQGDSHSSVVRPLDFDLLGSRISVIEIIVRRHHGSPRLLKCVVVADRNGIEEIPSQCQSTAWLVCRCDLSSK